MFTGACISFYILGVVLGSFYYGYVTLQIPGGWLALKVGGTRLFGLAVLIASILTLLTPVASRTSVVLLIIVRVGEGLVLVSIQLLKCVIREPKQRLVTSKFILYQQSSQMSRSVQCANG